MKYLFFILTSVVLIIFILMNLKQSVPQPATSPFPEALPKPAATLSSGYQVILKGQTYRIYLQKITPRNKLRLIPNFTEKKSTLTLLEENGCNFASNAGFYTTASQPLGSFLIKDSSISAAFHPNLFFNGFMFKSATGFVDIGNALPKIKMEFYFQSGPLFTPDQKLEIKADESARRVLAGKTSRSDLYLIAITNSGSIFSGPYLQEVPEIIQIYNSQSAINQPQFNQLLNLDGGSASAFYNTEGVALGELTSVGSFLCGKN